MFSYYTGTHHLEKRINLYSNEPLPGMENKFVSIAYCDISLEQIANMIQGKLFPTTENLRLFNSEGIEIFEEDLKYLKTESTIFVSVKGQDFDSERSMAQFTILEILGQGGFGKVMLGKHKVTGEKRAIKIVDARKIGNAQDIDIVFREAEMLKMLNHKNIVKIHNCFTLTNMQVAFIMDYLEGGNLAQYLTSKKKNFLSENESKEIFYQLVDAMIYCHYKKVIHRDLKLENVMFDKFNSRNVQIVDFGIAGLQTNFNVDAVEMGSLLYMPPEIFGKREKKIGIEVDVWALGVILFALVTGSLPFTGKTKQIIKQRIIQVDFIFPEDIQISGDCKNLITLLLEKSPKQRIQTPQILFHPWLNDLRLQKLRSNWQEINSTNQMFNIQFDTQNHQNSTLMKQHSNLKKTQLKKVLQSGITTHKLQRILQQDQQIKKANPQITIVINKTLDRQDSLYSPLTFNGSQELSGSQDLQERSSKKSQYSEALKLPLIHTSLSPDTIKSARTIKVNQMKARSKRYHSPQEMRNLIKAPSPLLITPNNNQSKLRKLEPLSPQDLSVRIISTHKKRRYFEEVFLPGKTFQRVSDNYTNSIHLLDDSLQTLPKI